MKTYDSYKETGVQWLGQIPSHWKFSSLIYALKGKIIDGPHETPDVRESGIPFVSVDSINESENVDFSIVKKFISNEDYERFKKKTNLEINDVIFTKAATIGKTAIVKSNDYMVWSPLAILKPSKETYFKYLYYVVSSKGYRENVFLSATFNTQWNIGMRDLEKTSIPRPPYDEQKAIADFLDVKIAELDAQKESLLKQIEILKELKLSIITNAVTKGLDFKVALKSSGKEFIGDIPEHWCLKKIKFCTVQSKDGIKMGPFGSSLTGKVLLDRPYKVYGQWNVIGGDFTAGLGTISAEDYCDLQAYKVVSNDILISMMGTVGKCAIVPEGIQEGIMDSHIVKVRLDNTIIDSKFFMYVYDKDYSDIVFSQIQLEKKGSIMDGLNSTIIKNFFLPIPPLREQKVIVSFLDRKTAEIDEQIELQKQQIQLIDELKQSIISQAVTGKIKVF